MPTRPRRQEGVRGGNGQDDRAPGDWVGRISAALEEERLTLYEQPIFGLKSGRALRHEVLVRMIEGSEVIEARDFVGAAEFDGLVRSIDSWGVGEAIALAATGMAVNVNVSIESIGPDLLESVEGRLAEAGADPANLVLELTEEQLMRDEERSRELGEQVREVGCGEAVVHGSRAA